ncbi:MAG: protease modulator HflC [Oscillospiraceae bacterium]|jgi:membrane protease subunit HflC|nr:protease modulator HflC [Oscillospiraceae bacterium]
MKKIYKWLFASLLAVIVVGFGFLFTVREGSCAIVSRFGEIRAVYTNAGLHVKLPYPFEKIITYDTRSQYMDSGYTETLTNDKKNIIMQTYLIWNIEDPQKYYTSVGDNQKAGKYLNDLVANVKNGVMGNYQLSALVSTDLESIQIDTISDQISTQIAQKALGDYGIHVESVKIKRLALPNANVKSVFEQMIADRQKQVTQLLSEGDRDAAIIMSEANARAAEIIAEGKLKAAEIDAETEKKVAGIYGDAYDANSELFIFLKNLIALENSVNADTVIIMKSEDSPFSVVSDLQ